MILHLQVMVHNFLSYFQENGAVIKSFVELPATYFWYLYVPEPEILVAFNAADVVAEDCMIMVPLLFIALIFMDADAPIVRILLEFTVSLLQTTSEVEIVGLLLAPSGIIISTTDVGIVPPAQLETLD